MSPSSRFDEATRQRLMAERPLTKDAIEWLDRELESLQRHAARMETEGTPELQPLWPYRRHIVEVFRIFIDDVRGLEGGSDVR